MLSVSNYHYIRNDFDSKYPSIFGVSPSKFREQLMLLNNQGQIITPKELLENNDEILKSKENYFLITFDDGLKEQFEIALPILDQLNMKAVFFVNSINFQEKKVSTVHKIHLLRSIIPTSKFLEEINKIEDISFSKTEKNRAKEIYIYDDKESAILKYLLNFKLNFQKQEQLIKILFDIHFDEKEIVESLYMSESNIKELAKKCCLGSHTHSHYPLGLLDNESIRFELKNSKSFLETITSSRIDLVSYPYGTPEACTKEVAKIAKEERYALGFTTKRNSNTFEDNKLLLNRFDCNDMPGGKNFKNTIL